MKKNIFNTSGITINCFVNKQQQPSATIRNSTIAPIGSISSVTNLTVAEQLGGRSMEAGIYEAKPADFTELIEYINSNSRKYPNKAAVITVDKSLSSRSADIQWIE